MTKILIAECKQEVSTFNPHCSGYDDFAIRRGADILRYHRAVRNEVGGALHVFDSAPGVQVIPTYSAHFITSGGTLPTMEVMSFCGFIVPAPMDRTLTTTFGCSASNP